MRRLAKKKPGRKPKGGRSYTVKLTDEVADQLRRLGDGNLTRGIEIAAHAEKVRSLKPHEVETQTCEPLSGQATPLAMRSTN